MISLDFASARASNQPPRPPRPRRAAERLRRHRVLARRFCSASARTCRTRFSAWIAFCVASMARLMAEATFSGRRKAPLIVS